MCYIFALFKEVAIECAHVLSVTLSLIVEEVQVKTADVP